MILGCNLNLLTIYLLLAATHYFYNLLVGGARIHSGYNLKRILRLRTLTYSLTKKQSRGQQVIPVPSTRFRRVLVQVLALARILIRLLSLSLVL